MRHRYWVLTLLFFLSIITYLDRVCIAVAGPRMQADLGITPEKWGWVVGAFTISYALFEVPSGALGDRLGTRRVLTRIVLWWSAFTTLTGTVSNFNLLLLVRFCFGVGEAGAYPNSSSTISRWFPAGSRAGASGVVWMASRVGGLISPLLVVPIQQAYGWRASFYVFGVVGLAWCAVWWWYYRDRPSLMPGITQQELDEVGTSAGDVQHHAVPWKAVFRSRNMWTIMLMYHTYCWGSYFYLSWLHTYLQKGRGFSEDDMKFYSALPFAAGILGNLLGGLLSDMLVRRIGVVWGRRSVGAIGLALSAILMLATALTPNRYHAVAFLTLGYMSMDMMLPVSWAVCLDVGRGYAGAISGCMNMAGQFGSFAISLTFGYLVKWFGDYNLPLIPMAAMLGISALLFLRIDPRQQIVPEDTPRAPHPQPTPELTPA